MFNAVTFMNVKAMTAHRVHTRVGVPSQHPTGKGRRLGDRPTPALREAAPSCEAGEGRVRALVPRNG